MRNRDRDELEEYMRTNEKEVVDEEN